MSRIRLAKVGVWQKYVINDLHAFLVSFNKGINTHHKVEIKTTANDSSLLLVILTSIPWAARLSWLENAYLCPLFSTGDFDL